MSTQNKQPRAAVLTAELYQLVQDAIARSGGEFDLRRIGPWYESCIPVAIGCEYGEHIRTPLRYCSQRTDQARGITFSRARSGGC